MPAKTGNTTDLPGRRWAGVVALLLHGLVLLALPAKERRGRTARPQWRAVERIELSTDPKHTQVLEADAPSSQALPPRVRRPSPRGLKTAKKPHADGKAERSGDAGDTDARPSDRLALLGVRRQSRQRHGGLPPRYVGQPRARVGTDGKRRVAPKDAPPRRRADRLPRSFTEAGFKHRKDGSWIHLDRNLRFRARVSPDGRLSFRDLPGFPAAMPGLSELVRSAKGEALYRQEKQTMISDTQALRTRLSIAFVKGTLDRELGRLSRDLEILWNAPESIRRRRRRLFERWDECGEEAVQTPRQRSQEGTSGVDEARWWAAKRARHAIEAFVRTHAPSGTTKAYTKQELDAFNRRRRSRERFDPYGAAR